MAFEDVLIVCVYFAAVLGLGAWLQRGRSTSWEDYTVANRGLRWWSLGLSDVAGNAGADAFWVSVVFTAAFMGFYRVWWISWVVALPLGLLWARYWRRLPILTPNQFFEFRYSGGAAARFRGIAAVYETFVTRSVVLAYVLKGLAQVMTPFFPWSVDTLLLVVCGISLVYAALAGMRGVVFSDVLQFLLVMAGRIALACFVLDAAGGWDALLDRVEALRGEAFLRPYPPGEGEAFGTYQVDPLSMGALAIVGLAKAPGFGEDGQRFLAARSEKDALGGHLLNLVLSLAVRMIPILVIGLGAVALFDRPPDSLRLWGDMVKSHANPGWVGLLLTGVLAGYMSTIDTYVHAASSTMVNDLLRRHVPHIGERVSEVWLGRLCALAFMASVYLWAHILMGRIDGHWITFINTVVALFILPMNLLRWCYWRVNIWSEIVAMVGAFPLAYLLWFPLGFKDKPYWISFSVLFGSGWLLIMLITFLAKPTDRETLERFYKTVRPLGLWLPVSGDTPRRDAPPYSEWVLVLAALCLAVSLVVGLASTFARQSMLAGCCGFGIALSSYALVRMLRHKA